MDQFNGVMRAMNHGSAQRGVEKLQFAPNAPTTRETYNVVANTAAGRVTKRFTKR